MGVFLYIDGMFRCIDVTMVTVFHDIYFNFSNFWVYLYMILLCF